MGNIYRQPLNWGERDRVVIDAIQSVLEKSPQSGFLEKLFSTTIL